MKMNLGPFTDGKSMYIVILAASAGSVGEYIVIGLAKSKMGLLQGTTRFEVQRRA